MNIEKIIPLTNDRAVTILDNGSEKIVKLETSKDAKFRNKGVLKQYSNKELTTLLSNAENGIDEVTSLLEAIGSYLVDRILNIHLENDKEAQDDLRKVFRLLDITSSKINEIKIYTSTTNNSLIIYEKE